MCRTVARDDRGESLLELIVSVAIMGVAVVAIVGGIGASIFMSDIHRKETTAGWLARNFAEQVAGNYRADGAYTFATPSGYTASVTALKCWDGATFTTDHCPADLQQVTLTVTSNDDRASESVVVIARKPGSAP